jgi:hypothetical protein
VLLVRTQFIGDRNFGRASTIGVPMVGGDAQIRPLLLFFKAVTPAAGCARRGRPSKALALTHRSKK